MAYWKLPGTEICILAIVSMAHMTYWMALVAGGCAKTSSADSGLIQTCRLSKAQNRDSVPKCIKFAAGAAGVLAAAGAAEILKDFTKK